MIIKTKTREEIKNILESIEDISVLDNMIKLASCSETGSSDVVIYVDKNDNEMMCLCEDDDCQFEEECVHSLDDVMVYLNKQFSKMVNGG